MNKPPVPLPIQMDRPDSNPILIAVEKNQIMGRYDVVLVVGNFATGKEAEAVGKKLQRLVEKKLGSRPASLAKGH
jgi:hypothetical protein